MGMLFQFFSGEEEEREKAIVNRQQLKGYKCLTTK